MCWRGRRGWGLGRGYVNAVDDEPSVKDDARAFLRDGALCAGLHVSLVSVWLVGHWWATLKTKGSGEGKEGYGAQVLVGAREADGLVAHMR